MMSKKSKIALFFLISYIVLVPIINSFMKVLEKCFGTDLNTIDINIFNLFTVVFRNGIILISWIIINAVIILILKNLIITKENARIEIEGINLKKKDRNFWYC